MLPVAVPIAQEAADKPLAFPAQKAALPISFTAMV
jgi:hypothetical protein